MWRQLSEESHPMSVSPQQLPKTLASHGPAASRHEQIPARPAPQDHRPSGFQVMIQSAPRRLAIGNDALLVALAANPQDAQVALHGCEIQAAQFADPETGGI